MREDRWLTRLRFVLGSGVLVWELQVDRLHHWPPTFVLAVWLLGGPVEQLVRFFTDGRIQIVQERAQRADNEQADREQKAENDQADWKADHEASES
jgi:hypothetical protein